MILFSETQTETQVGLKHDSTKPRMDLISPIALAELAAVLTFGAQKYSANNWRSGISYSKIIAAMHRHLAAISAGIDTDAESNLLHAAHLMCECMFMIEFVTATAHNLDDRYKLTEEQKNLLEGMLAGNAPK